jgi:hypothetical protein
MTPLSIPAFRLYQQGIQAPRFTDPAEVVRWMGAMQAQDYHQVVWAVGARMRAGTLAQVEQAIAEGRILRTWPQRGTIHWVTAEDAAWMVALSADRMIAKDARRLQQLELDQATIDRCGALFQKVLTGRRAVTRTALLEHLVANGIPVTGQRGYHILAHLGWRGLICIGPMQGKEQTFVLLDEWAGQQPRLTRDEARVELARRYFISHGPATVQDFAWWAGQTLTDARAGLEGAKAALISETVQGQVYWLAAAARPADPGSCLLLPGFDEYLLGYTDRAAVLEPQHAAKVCPGGNGVFYPMIVIDGQIVGTWKRTLKKQTVVISRQSFTDLSPAQSSALEEAARRYAAFLGLTATFA